MGGIELREGDARGRRFLSVLACLPGREPRLCRGGTSAAPAEEEDEDDDDMAAVLV